MATARILHRSFSARRPTPLPPPLLALRSPMRSASASASASGPPPPPRGAPRQQQQQQQQHEFSKACAYLGSWEPVTEPRVAEARLGRLRRDYAREVKQLRREYAYEVELQRVERARRDEARREAARLANEQRKAAKAAAAQTRAAERRAFEEDFRQTLLKERAEKLESWRAKEKSREEKKAAQKGLLRQQSSMWVSEENLEKRILEAIVDATPL
ncbi:involucrin [Ananas comosus]|uniref:Involucrin n=1 Tax=Ananas comosus TaxID=4615 RepID=A0A6P5GSC4_ANACO|nr:involucrin [Ananas comosus]